MLVLAYSCIGFAFAAAHHLPDEPPCIFTYVFWTCGLTEIGFWSSRSTSDFSCKYARHSCFHHFLLQFAVRVGYGRLFVAWFECLQRSGAMQEHPQKLLSPPHIVSMHNLMQPSETLQLSPRSVADQYGPKPVNGLVACWNHISIKGAAYSFMCLLLASPRKPEVKRYV